MLNKILGALLVSATLPALAAGPAAPEVIYRGVTKQLQFDWNYVPRANYYEVWYQANASAAWAKFGERPSSYPHWDQNVSAHLLHWSEMRWEIKACNPSGCTGTGPIDLGSTVVLTPGFFTALQPKNNARLGEIISVSEDAQTAVAATARAIVVFRRVGGRWIREATITAGGSPAPVASLSLSRDGNLLVVGIPQERDGSESSADPAHGAVYLFRRTGSSWALDRRVSNPEGWLYGGTVHVAESGDRFIANFYRWSVSDATSATDIYTRNGDAWSTVGIVNPGATYCTENMLSGDGQKIARRCSYAGNTRLEILGAPDWGGKSEFWLTLPSSTTGYVWGPLAVDHDATTVVSAAIPANTPETIYKPEQWQPEVVVLRRSGAMTWRQVATLRPDEFQHTQYASRTLFGQQLALSRNGEFVAVLDQHSTLPGLVEPPPTQQGGNFPRGGIYVFERNGTNYRLRRHVGVTTQAPNDARPVVGEIAFGDAGKTLAIGHPGSRSNGQGVDGGRWNTSLTDAGALWLY